MTHNPDPLTVTVIGAAGFIGGRHVEHLIAEDLTVLHSIVDPTVKGEELATRHGVPYYRDLEELLASAQRAPEAAIIATPSSLHIAQAVVMLRAGTHVLVEKPLCSTTQEASPLIEASRETSAGVLVGFHRRFNPYILRLKSILSGKSSLGVDPLGRVVAVSGLWCTRKPLEYFTDVPWRKATSSGGGVILTNLSHELDLAYFLFGDIKRVYAEPGARTRGFDTDETVTIVLSFTSGCVGTFVLSDTALTPYNFESATGENPNLAAHHQPIYTIMGTKGTINFPNFEHWAFRGDDREDPGGDWTKPLTRNSNQALGFGPDMATHEGPNAPFTTRLTHWVRAIRGEEPLNCTLQDGLKNVKLLEAVAESVKTGLPVIIEA